MAGVEGWRTQRAMRIAMVVMRVELHSLSLQTVLRCEYYRGCEKDWEITDLAEGSIAVNSQRHTPMPSVPLSPQEVPSKVPVQTVCVLESSLR